MKSPEPPLIAAVPLKECIRLPGIKDGSLFQKNVRQSLGSSNIVNKGKVDVREAASRLPQEPREAEPQDESAAEDAELEVADAL